MSQANSRKIVFLYTSKESQEIEITETQRALAQLGFGSQWSSSRLFLEGQEFGTPSSERISSAPIYQKELHIQFLIRSCWISGMAHLQNHPYKIYPVFKM